jgi:hypothetical protein
MVQDLIDARTKDATASYTDLDQQQMKLNKDWQDFTARIGPGVVQVLDWITQAADTGVQILGEEVQIIQALVNSPGKIGDVANTLIADYGSFFQIPGGSSGSQIPSGGYTSRGAPHSTTSAPNTTNNTTNVTVNGANVSDPQATARTVAAVMRQAQRI